MTIASKLVELSGIGLHNIRVRAVHARPFSLTIFTNLMFDPLSSTSSVFGGTDSQDTPSWPTTPHPPGSPIPNLRRALTPVPPTPDKGPSPGLYGKEPQIYGQPEAGLISPRDTVGSNGVNYEKAEPYLRVRINGLDRNRRDILVKLDAQVRPIPL